jgi:hypothetical protein
VTIASLLHYSLAPLFGPRDPGRLLLMPTTLLLLLVFLRARRKPLMVSMFVSAGLCMLGWGVLIAHGRLYFSFFNYLVVFLIASPVAVYFGLFIRVIRHYYGGKLFDIACGAFWGTVLGAMLGNYIVRSDMANLLLRMQKQSAERVLQIDGTPIVILSWFYNYLYIDTWRLSLNGYLVCGICITVGTILGAVLTAINRRKLFGSQSA